MRTEKKPPNNIASSYWRIWQNKFDDICVSPVVFERIFCFSAVVIVIVLWSQCLFVLIRFVIDHVRAAPKNNDIPMTEKDFFEWQIVTLIAFYWEQFAIIFVSKCLEVGSDDIPGNKQTRIKANLLSSNQYRSSYLEILTLIFESNMKRQRLKTLH